MKKEIISITGTLGSGKSSTADRVAQNLGYQRFSSGDFMRKIALERRLSINELSAQAENDPTIDVSIDDEVRKVGEMDKIVIDSRLAFHFIPNSFKVYLDLPPEIAKERILNNIKENALRRQSESSENPDEIFHKINERLESEKKRYKDIYGITNHTDKSNFDIVIDTNKNNLDEVVKIVLSEYQKWLNS
ncbi:MAG TPA: AAA family ATPase [Candidatus Paceibacterota bacterium]|nr:AAA family ATPase [Candidatus Paceibacterota bacterium]